MRQIEFALILPILLTASLPAADVGIWDRFEAAIENTKNYADPYNDVTLDVVYRSPGGIEVRSRGFYDGGSTWRIRFMPEDHSHSIIKKRIEDAVFFVRMWTINRQCYLMPLLHFT